MILTEEQAKERLNSDRNLVSRFSRVPADAVLVPTAVIESEPPPIATVEITEIKLNSRTPKKAELDEATKIEIASRARLGESQSSLGREFGVSQNAVHYLETGRSLSLNEKAVEERINQVQDVAMLKLLSSLGFMDDEKMKKAGVKDLSTIAANMSKIVSNTRVQKDEGNQVHLHLYAPELRTEKSFNVVEVRGS
jgi:hypothetical protein